MGGLDAATTVAQMKNILAFRDGPSGHLKGDAVGFAGFAVQPERSVAVSIQSVPPDKAWAIVGYRVICGRSVDGGVVGRRDGTCGSSGARYT